MRVEVLAFAACLVGVRWDGRRRHFWIHLGPFALVFLLPWRVLCSKCSRPAGMLCVGADGYGLGSFRDPLCLSHGVALGPCPDSVRFGLADSDSDHHVPIPERWFYRPLPDVPEPEPEPKPARLVEQYRRLGFLRRS